MSSPDNYSQHLQVVCTHLDQALADTEFDRLLIYSGLPPLRFNDDQHYPFRCNPQFRWLVPEAYTHSWLLYEPGKRPLLLLFQPDDYWHSVAELPNTFWSDHFDIQTFSEDTELPAALSCTDARAFLGEENAQISGLELGTRNPAPLVAILDWQRSYKTAYEQGCLREANRIAVRGHRAVARAMQSTCSEMSLHLAYMKACGQGENRLPYDSIVALNEHAAVLHWSNLSAVEVKSKEIRSLLIDAGADCNGYAADITRTYARVVGLYGDLISAMDELQQGLVGSCKPGTAYLDLHRAAQRGIAGILHDFGVITVSAEDAMGQGLVETFLPHGLGHQLGLQVHDVAGQQVDRNGGQLDPPADCPALRNTRRIEEGQVFTIEPGVYFIESLLRKLYDSSSSKLVHWPTVEKLMPYGGVRIEDNIVVLADAVENLTRNAFATASSDE